MDKNWARIPDYSFVQISRTYAVNFSLSHGFKEAVLYILHFDENIIFLGLSIILVNSSYIKLNWTRKGFQNSCTRSL